MHPEIRHMDYDPMSMPSASTSNANFLSMDYDLNDNQEDYYQRQLDVELALFMSAAGIKNITNNYFFRQFLSNFRPDFNVPQIGFDAEKLLNKTHIEIVSKMKQILANVDRFTLMANVVNLETDESDVLCISIGFKCGSKFNVMLLTVHEFDDVIDKENPSCNLLPYIGKALGRFDLDISQVICTMTSGFENIGVRSTQVMVNKPFYCQIEQQISEFMFDLFECSKMANDVRFIILTTIQDFYGTMLACREFEKRIGYKLDPDDYEEVVQMLITQRDNFTNLCKEFSVRQIQQNEWSLIERFFETKDLLQNSIKIFKDDTYFTIDRVVPELRKLSRTLTQHSLMNTNFVDVAEKFSKKFDYILNVDNPEFNPIFVLATFLSPEHYFDLSTKESSYAERLIESLIIKYESNPMKSIVDLIDKLATAKFDEELSNSLNQNLAITIRNQIGAYQNHLRQSLTETCHMSAYEFWERNQRELEKLALIANDLLCITFTATPPFESLVDFSNSPNSNDDAIQRGYSTKNPVDYFRWTLNKECLARNALLRLNWNFMNYDSSEIYVVSSADFGADNVDINENAMQEEYHQEFAQHEVNHHQFVENEVNHQHFVENETTHQFNLPMPPQPPILHQQEERLIEPVPEFTQPIVNNQPIPGSWSYQRNQETRALSPIRLLVPQNEEEDDDSDEEEEDPYGLNNPMPMDPDRSRGRSRSYSRSNSQASRSPIRRRIRSRSRSRSYSRSNSQASRSPIRRRTRSRSRSRSPAKKRRRSDKRSPRRSSLNNIQNTVLRPVLMIHNVDWERFNCQRIFNLFSAYGYVKKINFLRQDKTTCMVQMKNEEQANVAYRFLNGLPIFNVDLDIVPGRHEEIRHNPSEATLMTDGSKSCCEYSIRKVKPFPKPPNPQDVAKPCEKLAFANVPSYYDEDKLKKRFKECDGPIPYHMLLYEPDKFNCIEGLMFFEKIEDATEALMLYNNLRLKTNYMEVRFYNDKGG